MKHIITNKTGSKIILEYDETKLTKIKLTYIPDPSDNNKNIVKTITLKKEA